LTDGDFGGKTDNPDTHFVSDQRVDGLVNIAGVGGEEGTKDDEDFSRAMAGSVAMCICWLA
jgi:hypothetical protein